MKTLLTAGADLHHKTNSGKTAADLALKYGHTDIANMLASSNIMPIDIHEVLITDNGRFTSDGIIDNDYHGLFSNNHSQLVLEQASTYPPEIHIAINQSLEVQHLSFG